MSAALKDAIWKQVRTFVQQRGEPPETVCLGPGQFEELLRTLKPYDAATLATDRLLWGMDVVTYWGNQAPFHGHYVDAREL